MEHGRAISLQGSSVKSDFATDKQERGILGIGFRFKRLAPFALVITLHDDVAFAPLRDLFGQFRRLLFRRTGFPIEGLVRTSECGNEYLTCWVA